MIVQNITGLEKQFVFSNKVSVVLAADDTDPNHDTLAVLPDDPSVYTDALRYAELGLLNIVKGPDFATAVQSIDMPAHFLFLATDNPTDSEEVVVNGVTFEFDSNATIDTAGATAVTIGGDAEDTLGALAAALVAHASFAGYQNLGVAPYGAGGAALVIAFPEGVDTDDTTITEATAAVSVFEVAAANGDSYAQLACQRVLTNLTSDLVFATAFSSIANIDVVVMSYLPTAVTATNADDTIDAAGHPFLDNDRVVFTGDDLPAPLEAGTVYWVVNKAANTFKVAASEGGDAITLTDDGTGTRSCALEIPKRKSWDGGVNAGNSGGVIALDNTGSTDLVVTDLVFVSALGIR